MNIDIDKVINGLVEADNAGIGDTNLSRFYFELFSKIRQCGYMLKSVQDRLNELDHIVTDRFNDIELKKAKEK